MSVESYSVRLNALWFFKLFSTNLNCLNLLKKGHKKYYALQILYQP